MNGASITITNIKPEAERIGRLLHRISYESGKGMFDLVKQAMIFAAQTATKQTKPGKSGTAQGLAKKYKERPILKSSVKAGLYFYEMEDGKTLRVDHILPPWNWKNIKRPIDKVIQWWNKEINGWDYTAYTGSAENEAFRKIPHYGAAKVGWYGSLSKLGFGVSGTGENKAGLLSKMKIQKGALEAGIAITNMVDYAFKTSPESARIGLEAAEKRLVKSWEKKLQTTLAGTY